MSVSYQQHLQPQLAVDVIIDHIDKFGDLWESQNRPSVAGSTYRVGSDHEICILRKTQEPLPFNSFTISVETNRPIDNIIVKLTKLNFEVNYSYQNVNSSLMTIKTESNHPYGLHLLKIYIPQCSMSRAEIMRKRREKKDAKKARNARGIARRLPKGVNEPTDPKIALNECTTLFFQREAMIRNEKWIQRSRKRELKQIRNAMGLLRRLPVGQTTPQSLNEAQLECIESFYSRQVSDLMQVIQTY